MQTIAFVVGLTLLGYSIASFLRELRRQPPTSVSIEVGDRSFIYTEGMTPHQFAELLARELIETPEPASKSDAD